MRKRKRRFKLKPCPFCGSGEVYLCDDDPHHYGYSYVYCDECGCRTDYCEKSKYAIDDWNSRPDDDTTELKPCPFCGNTDPKVKLGIPSWFVRCDNCGVQMDFRETEREAVEAWNRRAKDAKSEND